MGKKIKAELDQILVYDFRSYMYRDSKDLFIRPGFKYESLFCKRKYIFQ